MEKVTLGERLRYAFDNFMARGTIALIGGLALASAAVIVIVSIVVAVATGGEYGLGDLLWMALLRTLDSGTMGGDQGPLLFLAGMLAVTFGGIFVISALIGVINNGIEGKLDELRKGRSRVIEAGHTVILGWSQQIFTVISELVQANANRPRACIVVLAPKDKVVMDDEIRDKVGSTGRTRIVCRTGDPMDQGDLALASLGTSRSIVILAPEDKDPDAEVIKAMLAITNDRGRRAEPYHIVAEIRDPRNLEVARMVGRDEVELVSVGELVSRIMAQTCRQSGLSVVYTELLDFGGDEIYFKAEPELVGRTFGEALLAYEDSAVLGLRPRDGGPLLDPPMETRIGEGDELIVIAEDDDTIRLSGGDVAVHADAIVEHRPLSPAPERTLILGWNWRAPSIITELDRYVPAGSEVMVVADHPDGEAELARGCAGVRNQSIGFRLGDTSDRRTLDALEVETYDHMIVLCYSDTLDPQRADARTLITLLHLRDIAARLGHDFSIVSEMLDIRNRALAEVTRADDFIVSDRLVSLMLAQVSENKHLNAVFADIFDPEGAEIYLKPAGDYVRLGEPIDFYTVVEAARRRGEVALGYRLKADAEDAAKGYGVAVNPDKSRGVIFAPDDRIVVLAES
ncbi:MAG: potassium transporter TrkA [Chloroflexi bacterium GWC2_73_18]|nr:MAG: potassium transporter TrkA [Chloroflexi bacterium GWC2_73_18]